MILTFTRKFKITEVVNNKEFTAELSRKTGYSVEATSQFITSLIEGMSQYLQDGKSITIQNFGLFEVKKKAERISVNPVTKKRMLVPPKLALTYKPSAMLKEKFK